MRIAHPDSEMTIDFSASTVVKRAADVSVVFAIRGVNSGVVLEALWLDIRPGRRLEFGADVLLMDTPFMQDRGHLLTEQRNPRSLTIDRMSLAEAFDVINAEDATVPAAVARAKPEICAAIELVVDALGKGGRLIYVGAGTSGRLGVLDASECPPTFLTDPELIQGAIAGGYDALRRSIEGAEDVAANGTAEVDARDVGPKDVVFGIATGGTTPYVHAAIARAKQRGARTVFFACVGPDEACDEADVSLRVLTGPEVITGSTRMKAGTATKLVLNMVTTIAMVRLGKTYENLMVDVNTFACDKLVDRATRIVQTITGLGRERASALLDQAGGKVKAALVMHQRGVDFARAEALLLQHAGQIAAITAADERRSPQAGAVVSSIDSRTGDI